MEKEILIRELNYISKVYFEKKDYISAGQINRAIDVVEDYFAVLPQADVIKSVCDDNCEPTFQNKEGDFVCGKCSKVQ